MRPPSTEASTSCSSGSRVIAGPVRPRRDDDGSTRRSARSSEIAARRDARRRCARAVRVRRRRRRARHERVLRRVPRRPPIRRSTTSSIKVHAAPTVASGRERRAGTSGAISSTICSAGAGYVANLLGAVPARAGARASCSRRRFTSATRLLGRGWDRYRERRPIELAAAARHPRPVRRGLAARAARAACGSPGPQALRLLTDARLARTTTHADRPLRAGGSRAGCRSGSSRWRRASADSTPGRSSPASMPRISHVVARVQDRSAPRRRRRAIPSSRSSSCTARDGWARAACVALARMYMRLNHPRAAAVLHPVLSPSVGARFGVRALRERVARPQTARRAGGAR